MQCNPFEISIISIISTCIIPKPYAISLESVKATYMLPFSSKLLDSHTEVFLFIKMFDRLKFIIVDGKLYNMAQTSDQIGWKKT